MLQQTMVLASVQILISVAWYSLVVIAVGQVRRALTRPAVRNWIDLASGSVLIALCVPTICLGRL